MGDVFKRGPVWWIRYSHRGKKHRESARSAERRDAARLLRRRLADLSQGRPSGPDEERVTFDQIAADYIEERTLKGVPKARLQWSSFVGVTLYFDPRHFSTIEGAFKERYGPPTRSEEEQGAGHRR